MRSIDGELFGSVGTSLLSLALPLVALALVVLILLAVYLTTKRLFFGRRVHILTEGWLVSTVEFGVGELRRETALGSDTGSSEQAN